MCQYGSYIFKRLGWDTSEDGYKIGHQCVSVIMVVTFPRDWGSDTV